MVKLCRHTGAKVFDRFHLRPIMNFNACLPKSVAHKIESDKIACYEGCMLHQSTRFIMP